MISPYRIEEPATLPLSNQQVADRLEEVADMLDAQNGNPYRVRAYRSAAQTLRELKTPVQEILEQAGAAALTQIPGIGESLARSITELTQSGRLPLLERLRGDIMPERVFTTVPGIGPHLAALIHEQLNIATLAELEAAAYDGRLAKVPGFGQKRLRAVRESVAGRGRPRRQTSKSKQKPQADVELPPVAELLDIDAEYRRKAAADRLTRIAPRRFNPSREAWLPIMHTERGRRHYTALYSNTARAHELGTTHDWVVIYCDDARDTSNTDRQWTVVTSQFGDLKGRRIVRGREAECASYYAELDAEAANAATAPPSEPRLSTATST